jgi:peroxiredoxin
MQPYSSYTSSLTDSFTFFASPELVQPLAEGTQAPDFTIPAEAGVWTNELADAAISGKVRLQELPSERPLVISFFSPHWNHYGQQHLQALLSLYPGIRALGGELLVLTSEPLTTIQRLARYYQLPFSIARDAAQVIASQFGVFDPLHPVWERISGITQEVPLPATYVIAPSGRIAHAFVDADFSEALPVRSVLSAVYTSRNKRIKKVA